MKLFTLAFSLLLSLSFLTTAQNPTPTPIEDIVKISTALIQIDVTVTDKAGNIINNLKPEDFEIYENGKKQEITNFSFIQSASNNQSIDVTQKSEVKSNSAIPVPPVKFNSKQIKRTYAIVVDDLGISFSSVFWIRQELKKFVNEKMQEGDLVAILRTGTGRGALQSFTSDKRLLLAAIDKISWNANGRVGINSFEPIRRSLREERNGMKKSSSAQVQGIDEEMKNQKELADSRRQSFTVGTIGTLTQITKGMSDLPGRKSILLLSEGFPIFSDGTNNLRESNNILDFLQVLADLANRASVVIHTIDPRGSQSPGDATAQDDIGVFDSQADKKRSQRNQLFKDTQQSLQYLAYSTGGTSYANQNEISFGLKKAINEQDSFYLLAYQPNDETFDEKKNRYNNLEIKVNRPDLRVRYRSGFFAVADEKINQLNQTPQQKLLNALISPFGKNEINLSLYSLFYNDSQNRNFIRSLVHIDPQDLNFSTDNNGLHKATFEIAYSLYDSNGTSTKNKINQVTLQFDKERFQKVQKDGIIYNLAIPIPKSGAYQFRIALQDTASEKVGAASQFVEVPNLDKKNLTLSNLIVKNYTLEKWKTVASEQNDNSGNQDSDVFLDTAVREFNRGTKLSYFYIIYNAKRDSSKNTQLQTSTRLFHNGKLILEGDLTPINTDSKSERIEVSNAITLGTDLQTGDYVLQIVVLDSLAKKNNQIAAQSIDFRIVE